MLATNNIRRHAGEFEGSIAARQGDERVNKKLKKKKVKKKQERLRNKLKVDDTKRCKNGVESSPYLFRTFFTHLTNKSKRFTTVGI